MLHDKYVVSLLFDYNNTLLRSILSYKKVQWIYIFTIFNLKNISLSYIKIHTLLE